MSEKILLVGSLTPTGGILIGISTTPAAAFSPSSTVIMVGCQKLGLFRNVVVVATVVGATASASIFIEENLVSTGKVEQPPDWGMLRRSRCIQIFL